MERIERDQSANASERPCYMLRLAAYMYRLAARAVMDLVAATRAVGDDEIARASLAYGRQQAELAHGEGDVDRLRAIAEGARHAAAAHSIGSTSRPGIAHSVASNGAHHRESLLVAVAMLMRDAADLVLEGQAGCPRLDVRGQKLFEQEGSARHWLGL